MKTKQLGTQHGTAVRSAVGKAAHATLMTVGSVVDTAAGAATNVGFFVVSYVAGFAQGLVRSGNE